MNVASKLRLYGPEALSKLELWKVVLGSEKAAKSVSVYIKGSERVSMREILSLEGLGGALATRTAAVLELARRLFHKEKQQ